MGSRSCTERGVHVSKEGREEEEEDEASPITHPPTHSPTFLYKTALPWEAGAALREVYMSPRREEEEEVKEKREKMKKLHEERLWGKGVGGGALWKAVKALAEEKKGRWVGGWLSHVCFG